MTHCYLNKSPELIGDRLYLFESMLKCLRDGLGRWFDVFLDDEFFCGDDGTSETLKSTRLDSLLVAGTLRPTRLASSIGLKALSDCFSCSYVVE